VSGSFLLGATVGAALAYLFDPERGRRRRHVAQDRVVSGSRRSVRSLVRTIRVTAAQTRGHAQGLAHRLHPGPSEELDDATLAHKVESVIYRDPKVPKGKISINAEQRCVFLRGEVVSAELIADLEKAVRKIPGVRDVENLLHLPGTPAPASHVHPRLAHGEARRT
jgi:osmotically-inducible protein OsmY